MSRWKHVLVLAVATAVGLLSVQTSVAQDGPPGPPPKKDRREVGQNSGPQAERPVRDDEGPPPKPPRDGDFEGPGPKPPRDGGPKPKPPRDGDFEGPGPKPPRDGGPGGGFRLLPRFVLERINLSPDQQKQIAELEKETKAKLYKILTPEQQRILEEARPPRPGEGGPGGPGGPDGGRPEPGPGRRGPGGGPGGDQPPRPQRPASE